jgi:hypothetical protein
MLCRQAGNETQLVPVQIAGQFRPVYAGVPFSSNSWCWWVGEAANLVVPMKSVGKRA